MSTRYREARVPRRLGIIIVRAQYVGLDLKKDRTIDRTAGRECADCRFDVRAGVRERDYYFRRLDSAERSRDRIRMLEGVTVDLPSRIPIG